MRQRLSACALALWASVEAFGGDTSFVTVTVVTMIGGTLASAAPTPGGVGAVEAALIGGLAAFGVPAAVGGALGAAVPGADALAAGIRRLAGHAVDDGELEDLELDLVEHTIAVAGEPLVVVAVELDPTGLRDALSDVVCVALGHMTITATVRPASSALARSVEMNWPQPASLILRLSPDWPRLRWARTARDSRTGRCQIE